MNSGREWVYCTAPPLARSLAPFQPTFAINMQICISVAHLPPAAAALHSNASIHPSIRPSVRPSIVASGISTSSHRPRARPIGLPDTTAGSSTALLNRFAGANQRMALCCVNPKMCWALGAPIQFVLGIASLANPIPKRAPEAQMRSLGMRM